MGEDGLHKFGIDWKQFFRGGVLDVGDSYIGSESGRDFVSTNGSGGVHRGHDLDSFKVNELQVLIIETLIAHNLLQKGYQLDGIVFIWLGKVDILKIDY